MSELSHFREVESKLAERLRAVRLILELGLSKDEHEELRETLKAAAKQWGGPKAIGLNYPAIYATSLTFTGLYELHAGELWDRVPKEIRNNGPERGPAFVTALNQLGLETFQSVVDGEPTQQYVMRILAHGGVPHAYLDKFASLLIEEFERGRTDPDSLLAEWNVNRARLESLQKATQRFLLYGGEPAVDFLARCLAVLEEGVRTAIFPSPTLAGLSAPVVEALERVATEDETHGAVGVGVGAPRMELDPYGDLGPQIVLPAIVSRRRGQWNVQTGGDRPTRHHATGLRDTVVPVPPADTYRVTYDNPGGRMATWEFSGPGTKQILAFAPDTGQQVAYHGALALDEAHLVAPGETRVDAVRPDASMDGPSEVSDLPELTGEWSSWRQLYLDLRGVEKVVLTWPDGRKATLSVVRPRTRPELESEPVEAVSDEAGNPVFSRPPVIRLPQDNEHGAWQVRLDAPDGSQQTFEAPVTEIEIDLSKQTDPEAFGSYRLTIHGPLGSDLRTRFTVAPGLIVERPDRVWLPSHGIPEVKVLSDASVNTAPPGELVSVVFDDSSTHTELQIHPETGTPLTLHVHVDRLLWTVAHATKQTVPEDAHPLRIGREEFEDHLEDLLLLSTGRSGVGVRLQLWEDGELSQQSEFAQTKGAEGRWRFDLAQFSDRIRRSGAASLQLRLAVDGEPVHLADIVDKTSPTSVKADRGPDGKVEVTFTKTREVAGVEARVWSLSRPWTPAITVKTDPTSDVIKLDRNTPPGWYLFELDIPDDWSRPERPDPSEGEALKFRIDDDEEYYRYLDDLDSTDPYALLERALSKRRGRNDSPVTPDEGARWNLVEPAGMVCEEILKWEDPAKTASKLDPIIDLFWESDNTLADWLVAASEAGTIGEETITHLSLCIVFRPEETGAKCDPIDAHLLERLWMAAPVVAALFDVPYVVNERESRFRCREYLGWVPPVYPDRSGGQLTIEDVNENEPGSELRRPDSRDLDEDPDLRGLMSRDNLRRATREWLGRMDEHRKQVWSDRTADLAKRLDLLKSGPTARRELWRGVNSRRFRRTVRFEVEDWMDLPAVVMSDVLAAEGLLNRNGDRNPRAITKLHEAVPTARRLIEHDLILSVILRSRSA